MAVVKSNAYGHGAVLMGRLLERLGVGGLAVATLEEAVELREARVRLPILVLNPGWPAEAPWVVRHDLIQSLSSMDMLYALSRAARAQGRVARVHVEVDTGMNRLGWDWRDAARFVEIVGETPALRMEGLYTHLATADGVHDAFAREQIRRILSVWRRLSPVLQRSARHLHVANSAALAMWPRALKSPFTLARPGLVLYGGQPLVGRQVLPLKPVMTVKAKILAVREVRAGTPVGYGQTFMARRKTRVATIGMGYGQGYSRDLSNRGLVLVGGTRCPVIGRVCMDHVMVDVTKVPLSEAGDLAVVIGVQGGERITVEEHAGWLKTIPYVVMCGMNARVPRIIKGQK